MIAMKRYNFIKQKTKYLLQLDRSNKQWMFDKNQ